MSTLNNKVTDAKKVATTTETANILKFDNPIKEQNEVLDRKKEEIKKILSPVSADQRIKNAEIFQKMAEKHTFLRKKQDELQSYMVGRDGLKEKVVIKCEGCADFEVSNSFIVSKILQISADELENLVTQSENEILNYNI